jgi:2'-5' RNA ligase
MRKGAGGRCRCFFAVWPEVAAATALHEFGRLVRADCGGRLMRRDTLHLTLAFLGEIAADRVADAMRVADTIVAPPFELTLDRLDYWRHNRILWAGGVSPRLTFLAGSLGDGLRNAGFTLDAQPFVAHLTLLRDAHCAQAPSLSQPVVWPVREFVLAQSRLSAEGARYDIIGRWSLR